MVSGTFTFTGFVLFYVFQKKSAVSSLNILFELSLEVGRKIKHDVWSCVHLHHNYK